MRASSSSLAQPRSPGTASKSVLPTAVGSMVCLMPRGWQRFRHAGGSVLGHGEGESPWGLEVVGHAASKDGSFPSKHHQKPARVFFLIPGS